MNWTVYFTAACGGIAVGMVVGWVITELRYYGRFNKVKNKATADLAELKQAVASNILGLIAAVKSRLDSAVAEMAGHPQAAAMCDALKQGIDGAVAKADGNPLILARIAKECLPPMVEAAVAVKVAVAEIGRTRRTYDGLAAALTAVSGDFWKLVRAVIESGAPPESLNAVGGKLAAAHKSLGEDGLAVGLTKLAEVFAEMNRLVETHLPKRPDSPKEAN
jgi:hypothetical protein